VFGPEFSMAPIWIVRPRPIVRFPSQDVPG
jgi:hypothetical protein